MTRRTNGLVLALVIVAMATSGCSVLRKKFTREKPEEEAKAIKVREASSYIEDPSMLYERYYAYAKSWIDEMRLALEKGNAKRLEMSYNEAKDNITLLLNMIPEEFGDMKKKGEEIITSLGLAYNKGASLLNRMEDVRQVAMKIDDIRSRFSIDFSMRRQPAELWEKISSR